MNRKELEQAIVDKKEKILIFKKEIAELTKEGLLLSDEEQWFTEKIELVTIRDGRKKTKVKKLIGRVHWKEDFTDEATGEIITIERSQPVRIDGEWDY